MLTRYDPDRAPDPERWKATLEDQQIDIVERYHRRERIELPKPAVHAIFHVVVENQVAMGDEAPVAATVERLMGEGLSRHDALHAVGWVLARHMHRAATTDEPVDNEAYFQEVRELTARRWFDEAGQEED